MRCPFAEGLLVRATFNRDQVHAGDAMANAQGRQVEGWPTEELDIRTRSEPIGSSYCLQFGGETMRIERMPTYDCLGPAIWSYPSISVRDK
jgi:hypothetical protein